MQWIIPGTGKMIRSLLCDSLVFLQSFNCTVFHKQDLIEIRILYREHSHRKILIRVMMAFLAIIRLEM